MKMEHCTTVGGSTENPSELKEFNGTFVDYASKLIKHQIDTMWCINGLNELAKRNAENANVP